MCVWAQVCELKRYQNVLPQRERREKAWRERKMKSFGFGLCCALVGRSSAYTIVRYRNVVVVFSMWTRLARSRKSKRHTIRDCTLGGLLKVGSVGLSWFHLLVWLRSRLFSDFMLTVIPFVVLHGMHAPHSPLILWLSATMRSRFAVPSYLYLPFFISPLFSPFCFFSSSCCYYVCLFSLLLLCMQFSAHSF